MLDTKQYYSLIQKKTINLLELLSKCKDMIMSWKKVKQKSLQFLIFTVGFITSFCSHIIIQILQSSNFMFLNNKINVSIYFVMLSCFGILNIFLYVVFISVGNKNFRFKKKNFSAQNYIVIDNFLKSYMSFYPIDEKLSGSNVCDYRTTTYYVGLYSTNMYVLSLLYDNIKNLQSGFFSTELLLYTLSVLVLDDMSKKSPLAVLQSETGFMLYDDIWLFVRPHFPFLCGSLLKIQKNYII